MRAHPPYWKSATPTRSSFFRLEAPTRGVIESVTCLQPDHRVPDYSIGLGCAMYCYDLLVSMVRPSLRQPALSGAPLRFSWASVRLRLDLQVGLRVITAPLRLFPLPFCSAAPRHTHPVQQQGRRARTRSSIDARSAQISSILDTIFPSSSAVSFLALPPHFF